MKLSILIPTYNRPTELLLNLKIIDNQLTDLSTEELNNIEIFISDNSANNQMDLLSSLINKRNFKYYHQSKNIGSTENLFFCVENTSSDYLIILGDDDYFLKKGISVILDEINNNDHDIIYLKPFKFRGKITEEIYNMDSGKLKLADSISQLISMVKMNITFTSSWVLKRKTNFQKDYLRKYEHTKLQHLHLILNQIEGGQTAFSDVPVIAATSGASGSYDVLHTFLNEFLEIVLREVKSKELLENIKLHLYYDYIPMLMYGLATKKLGNFQTLPREKFRRDVLSKSDIPKFLKEIYYLYYGSNRFISLFFRSAFKIIYIIKKHIK